MGIVSNYTWNGLGYTMISNLENSLFVTAKIESMLEAFNLR